MKKIFFKLIVVFFVGISTFVITDFKTFGHETDETNMEEENEEITTYGNITEKKIL